MKEIDNIEDLGKWLTDKCQPPKVVQEQDLTVFKKQFLSLNIFHDSIFLGCKGDNELFGHLVKNGAFCIPHKENNLFSLHRKNLYSVEELFKGFSMSDTTGYENTFDYKVYKQYVNNGKANPTSIKTSLYRRLHDHSITDALNETLKGEKVVAVMGGHSMERQDKFYKKIAFLSRKLTQEGYLMVSGGGPGAMEATHLGAYFATKSEEDLNNAIAQIKIRPEGAKKNKEYNDIDWLHRAWKVRQDFPVKNNEFKNCKSVGIPTWLYGHEPPAPFATHVAKYFANSVREDGLLAIAKYGVIFAPGSAGTTQEIFQDACQNHYNSTGVISPMLLFGEKHWTEVRPLWDFLKKTAKSKPYGELLALTDDEEEIIRRIKSFNPEIYTL